MRKTIRLLTLAAAAALGAGFAPGALADLTIGVSISLTGPTSALGIPTKNGIALWPKEVAGEKLNVIVLDVAQNDSHLDVSYLQKDAKFNDDYLTPLKDLPLTELVCARTRITSLAPLKGMTTLRVLHCDANRLDDLTPIGGLSLRELSIDFDRDRHGKVLRAMKTLEKINGMPAEQFWSKE